MWGATVGEDVSGGRQGRVSHERSALRLIGWWRAAGGAFRCCILRPWSGSRRGWALAMAGRRGSAVSAMAGKSGGAADRAWQWSGGFDTVGGTTGKRRMAPSGSADRRDCRRLRQVMQCTACPKRSARRWQAARKCGWSEPERPALGPGPIRCVGRRREVEAETVSTLKRCNPFRGGPLRRQQVPNGLCRGARKDTS